MPALMSAPAVFFGVTTGEISRRGAGVVAAAVAQRVGLLVRQAGEEREILLEVLERLEDHRQLVILAEGRGRPILHVLALRDIDERQALGEALRRVPTARPRPLSRKALSRAAWHPAAAGRRWSPGREEMSGGDFSLFILLCDHWIRNTNAVASVFFCLFGGQRFAVAALHLERHAVDRFQDEAGEPRVGLQFVGPSSRVAGRS